MNSPICGHFFLFYCKTFVVVFHVLWVCHRSFHITIVLVGQSFWIFKNKDPLHRIKFWIDLVYFRPTLFQTRLKAAKKWVFLLFVCQDLIVGLILMKFIFLKEVKKKVFLNGKGCQKLIWKIYIHVHVIIFIFLEFWHVWCILFFFCCVNSYLQLVFQQISSFSHLTELQYNWFKRKPLLTCCCRIMLRLV